MLGEYFGWWTRQWAALLKPLLKPASGATDLILAVDRLDARDGADIALLVGGAAPRHFATDASGFAALRAALPGGRPRLRLRLPAGLILERVVTLPAAAEHDLGQVLRYEFDRLTPFSPEAVLWDWQLLRHDKRQGRLDVRLSLAQRAPLAPLLDRLQDHGLFPDSLESAPLQPAGPPRSIWLQPQAPRAGYSHGRRLAYGLCAALLLALCATPFLRQSLTLSRLDRQIAQLQPAVQAAARLRRTVAANSESGGVLLQERQGAGDPLQVLAAVTDALPDGTWLTQLSLQQRALHLEGESHAAAQLIGRLAGVSLLSNPAFAAPVTSDGDRHADIFAISAEVRP